MKTSITLLARDNSSWNEGWQASSKNWDRVGRIALHAKRLPCDSHRFLFPFLYSVLFCGYSSVVNDCWTSRAVAAQGVTTGAMCHHVARQEPRNSTVGTFPSLVLACDKWIKTTSQSKEARRWRHQSKRSNCIGHYAHMTYTFSASFSGNISLVRGHVTMPLLLAAMFFRACKKSRQLGFTELFLN